MSASTTVQLLVLERREPTTNMARFYVLSLEDTLFGDTALVREWGRLGRRGRRRLDLFEAKVAAAEALTTWLARKSRRGYVQVASVDDLETEPGSRSAFPAVRRVSTADARGEGRAA